MIQLFSGNIRFRNLIFVFVMASCPLFLFAQESNTEDASAPQDPPMAELTIEDAVKMAVENNLTLQISSVELGTKKRSSDFSWNQFIPDVGLRGTLGRLNEKPESQEIPFPPPIGTVSMGPARPQWMVQGNLSVSLNFNVAMIERMNNLKLDYQAGLITYDNAKKQLERDVRKAYNNILMMETNIQLLKENLASAEDQVAMARANYNAGLVPELTLLQARVAMENLKPTILEMENGLAVMQSSFAFQLGIPFGTALVLAPIETPDYINLNLEDLIAQASSVKPEIMALKQTAAIMKSNQKALVYRDFTPSLSLNWNLDPAFQGDPMKDSWGMKDGWKQSQGMFSVTLTMNLIPLLPFSAAGLERKALEDGITTLNLNLAQLVRGTEIEVYQTVLQLEKSQTNMDALNMTVDLALRSYRQTEEAYRNGLVELLEVQSARLEYQKAQNAVLQEQFNYLSGLIDLEYAIGVPFGTLSGEKK